MSLKKIFTTCVIALATFVGMQSEAISAYPDKAIKILVMSTPGSGTDLFARQLAPLLSAELGQSVLVVNQPGGGGNLAANTLIKSKNDGYTLALLGEDVVGLNFATANVSYKFEEIYPISSLFEGAFGLYSNPESPWKDFNDVVKTAKAENRPIKVAVFNAKSRVVVESLAKNAGINVTLVPSQSAATALTAVMGKHVELSCIGGAMSDSVIAGKTNLIGSLSTIRFNKIPKAPTVHEQGFTFTPYTSTVFLFSQASVPAEIRSTLEAALIKIAKTPEYKKIVDNLGFDMPVTLGHAAAQKACDDAYAVAMEYKASR